MRYIVVFLLLTGICTAAFIEAPKAIMEYSETMNHLHVCGEAYRTISVEVDNVDEWELVVSRNDNEITIVRKPQEVKNGK